jgi:phosphotransferase system enzyme I (PtsP)
LLLTLEEISTLISHSHNPAETLGNVVRLVHGRFGVAVCSVYLLDHGTHELVLSATVGLKPDSVGRVRMKLDEGLTGLVAETMSPVAVFDAFQHPRFKYFPEAGEDPYHSFLGVPLVDGGEVEGVLVVQTVEPREFTGSEVRMLVTAAAQVASLVADAALLDQVAHAAHGQMVRVPEQAPMRAVTLTGTTLSRGVGQGQAYVLADDETWRQSLPRQADNPTREKQRLARATESARQELATLSREISELVGEDHGAILHAQLLIMQDRTIESDLLARINGGASAEGALLATQDQYVAAFQRVASAHFHERVHDIKDVFHRILWHLQPRPDADPTSERVVLVAREASVLQLFAVDLKRLAGVVLEKGGPQSHAAILARSLGIPMVGLVSDFGALLTPGCHLRVDGDHAIVIVNPEGDEPRAPVPGQDAGEPAILDAALPRVEANLNLLAESVQASNLGVPGVGLFRSEFLFLARRTPPTEEEQVNVYRRLVRQMQGRPVSIRTFDLRADKLASYAQLGPLARALDWRLVLDSPPLQQLFREQVRAILRAGAEGPVRLMIPLVTRSELLDFVVVVLDEARTSLTEEGLDFDRDIPLGVMIEAAAAVPMVRSWADAVTWFALGTNDLTASALDLDRNDPRTAALADPLHPGVLHLIDQVIRDAHSQGKPVTVCGEMASDPAGTIALAALGVDAVSVAVSQYQRTRRTLASTCRTRLTELAPSILACRSARDVRKMLAAWV